MKKITSLLILSVVPFIVTAQNDFLGRDGYVNMEVFRICATLIFIILVIIFSLSILKRMLEYRIKNKIVEKGIPESLASSILQPNTKEDGTSNFKWFCILMGLGIGLSIVSNYYLGIHSLAIMSFSMAASFLAYHFFLRRYNK
jgi:hypothetical protein